MSDEGHAGRRRDVWWAIAGITLALITVAAIALLRPVHPPPLAADPHPVLDYGEAVRRLLALGNDDTCAIAPECRTRLLLHGHRTGRVVVLLHGLTNCPAQFDSLGRELAAGGANVVIPLIPRHGCADHATAALSHLNAPELTRFADRVIDAADALGDSVTVVGLSLGGVLAAWAVQERGDVERAVPIAPMFALHLAPGPFSALVTRVYRRFPNRFEWWDPRRREHLPGPRHVYPRWSWGSIGETLWLGAAVRGQASRRRAAGGSVALVTVGGDLAIDNAAVADMAETWRAHGVPVAMDAFEDSLHLNHDVIDPEQVGANPALVYPRLIRLIRNAPAAVPTAPSGPR